MLLWELKEKIDMTSSTESRTTVEGVQEQDIEQVRRVKGWRCFNVSWWETMSTTTIGNDIHINTDHPVRDIYLNGKKIREG